jgi:hypothetical protein
MNLKPIPNYEGLYSFDLNTNQVWGHKYKKYLKPYLNIYNYYRITLHKKGKEKKFHFHRIIYEIYKGEIPEKMQIDHIDGNTINNHIDNLRLATRGENNCNKKVQKNNLLGYKNISLTKSNTYNIQIKKNKKLVYCKTFKSLEEAITNRDLKLKEFHNDFMNLG